MNVKVIRINTGEEVVASIVEDNEDTLVVTDPIVAYNSGNGQIGFGPWAPLVKNGEDITVDKKYIVYMCEAKLMLLNSIRRCSPQLKHLVRN